MDVTQALRDTENALRDFIAATLERSLGPEWVNNCGVTSDRVSKWRERKSEEQRRQEAGWSTEALGTTLTFTISRSILKKHWQGDFSEALGEWRRLRYSSTNSLSTAIQMHIGGSCFRVEGSLVVGIAGDIGSPGSLAQPP